MEYKRGRDALLPMKEKGDRDTTLELDSGISVCFIVLQYGPHFTENDSSSQRCAVYTLYPSSCCFNIVHRMHKQVQGSFLCTDDQPTHI